MLGRFVINVCIAMEEDWLYFCFGVGIGVGFVRVRIHRLNAVVEIFYSYYRYVLYPKRSLLIRHPENSYSRGIVNNVSQNRSLAHQGIDIQLCLLRWDLPSHFILLTLSKCLPLTLHL